MGVPPNVIGVLVVLIIVLLCVLALLLVRKYAPQAAASGNSEAWMASIEGNPDRQAATLRYTSPLGLDEVP